jgi:DNA-binding transcriptional ArsR family regulator
LCGKNQGRAVFPNGLTYRIVSHTSQTRSQHRIGIIKALAHPARLAIAEALQGGELCVCDLRDLVGADLPTVSKHLTVMRKAGLLEMEKRGLNVFDRRTCPCLPAFFDCVDSLVPQRQKQSSAKVNRAKS